MSSKDFNYFEKLRLAMMIKQEIQYGYMMRKTPYKSDSYKIKKEFSSPLFDNKNVYQYTQRTVKSIHGILERNLKIIEIENGFEVHIPSAYGEKYIEDCVKKATQKWLKSLSLKGKVSEI